MRASPDNRDDYQAFQTLTTRWMDNDIYGHMNNVVHYSLFDSAVNAWLIERGVLGLKDAAQIGLVVETGCVYFAEMAFPDVVTAGLRVTKIGNSSARYEVGLFRNNDDATAARGFFVHVYVDAQTRRPQSIKPDLKAALASIAMKDTVSWT